MVRNPNPAGKSTLARWEAAKRTKPPLARIPLRSQKEKKSVDNASFNMYILALNFGRVIFRTPKFVNDFFFFFFNFGHDQRTELKLTEIFCIILVFEYHIPWNSIQHKIKPILQKH